MKKYFKKVLSIITKFFQYTFRKKEPDIVKELRKNEQFGLKDIISKVTRNIRAIGLLLIIIGALFLSYPTNFNLKISASIIFIGILFIIEINEKHKSKKINGRYLTIILTMWILIIFIITINIEYYAFFFLAILGVLIIKELLDTSMSPTLKKRMKELSYLLFIVFIIIIGQKIINITSI